MADTVVQLFHHTSTRGFIMWILVGDSSHIPILPRTSPTTIRNHEEQHIQPIRDEGKMKN
jgi:hypothetical protein